MRIILVVLVLVGITSCQDSSVSDMCAYVNCDLPIADTTSVPPLDNSSVADVSNQSKTYLKALQTGSKFYDSYGLLLPLDSTGSFIHAGDALIWNAVALSTLCILQSNVDQGKLDASYGVSTEIDALWSSFQKHLVLPTGTLIRHPESKSNTSISKDGMTGFFFLGAIAKKYKCTSVTQSYGTVFTNFVTYGRNNEWDFATSPELSRPTTTILTDRHILKAITNLYSLNLDLELGTSLHNHKENLRMMDILVESRYYCRLGFPDGCLRAGNMGVFPAHLTSLSNMVYGIDAQLSPSPLYTLSELQGMSSYLGRVGGSIGLRNWLYVAEYRWINQGTFGDVSQFLASGFPQDLPRENNPSEYGCDEFIWQRVPYNKCNGSATQYLGVDFLFPFALMKSL